MRHAIVATLALLAMPGATSGSAALPPATPAAAPPVPAPVLVELFTSEGCSSCPPADEELARLVVNQPVPGARVIALGEHVDYWNDLGWRDPFSAPDYTARQQRYALRFGLAGVYTPQLVVGGAAQVVGSDARGAREAVARAARTAGGRVDLRLGVDPSGSAALAIQATWPATPADVVVALTEDRATSRVERGENAGRTLRHVGVARSIATIGEGVGTWAGEVHLDRAPLHGPAHAVVFVQERGGGRVLAAGAIALAR